MNERIHLVLVHPARAALAAVLAVVCCLLTPAAGAWAGVSGGGTPRWSATYAAGTPAFSYAIAVSPDGSTVFTTGTTNYGTTAPGHAATVAVDAATGQQRWAVVYRSSTETGQRDRGTRIAVSPDGSKVFVTGEGSCPSGCGGGGFSGYSTIAYDASTGAELWSSSYPESGPGAYSIAVSPDGSKVFVNGGSSGTGTATVAYDASTGNQVFVIPSAGTLVPWKALAVSPDSATVFVATTDGGQSPCGFEFDAYDASNGTPRWSAVYPDCSLESNLAMALSPDGSTLYAAGYGNGGFATMAYDASSGTQLWAAVTNRLRVDGDAQPSVAVSPDGTKVFVLGYARCASPCTDQPLVTLGYDASSGNQLWESRYDSGGRNYSIDLAVSADASRVFVTGQEQMPCYSPCTTTQVNAPLIAYVAGTGTEAWVTDYQNNNSFALAPSPDGANVYVAGTFTTAASASAPRSSCSATACGYAMTAYNTHPGPGVSQDRDASPSYDGWSTLFDRTALGGAYRASMVKGQTVVFKTPVTRSVVWIAHRGRQEGRARVLIDGRRMGMFDLYAPVPSDRSFTFTGLSRTAHFVTIEVLGSKDAASRGRWVTVDGFNVGGNIREETALHIHYGAWKGVSNRAASGSSYRESGSSHASLKLQFSGGRIDWVTATGPAYGRARVVIDGVAHTVDLYRRRRHWRVHISYTRLGPGTHHITVRPLGTRDSAARSTNVVFDAFIVH